MFNVNTLEGLFVDRRISLNRSYICAKILRQLSSDPNIEALPFVDLDIDQGLSPDISVFNRATIQPNFFQDIVPLTVVPDLAIYVLTAGQTLASQMMKNVEVFDLGIKNIWVVESWSKTVLVFNDQGQTVFHCCSVSCGTISVNFEMVFS